MVYLTAIRLSQLKRLVKLVEANRVREAIVTLSYLEIPDKVKSYQNYGGELITAMIKCNVEPDVVVNVCKEWQSKGINKYAFSQATEAALTLLPYDNAKYYVDCLVKFGGLARPHIFAPLIIKSPSSQKVYELIENDLKPLGNINGESLFELFADFVWKRFDSIYDEFLNRCIIIGFTPQFLLNTYIAHQLNCDKLSTISEILGTKSFNIRIDYKLVTYLVSYITRNGITNGLSLANTLGSLSVTKAVFNSFLLINLAGHCDDAKLNRDDDDYDDETSEQFFRTLCEKMYQQKMKITPAAGDLLVSAKNDPELSKWITKLIDNRTKFMDEVNSKFYYCSASFDPIQSYEIRLKLMKKGSPRGIIRKLILAYCNTSHPVNGPDDQIKKRVEQLIVKLDGKVDNFTPAMASVLMSFFAMHGDLDKALYYKSLVPCEFTIDHSKLLRLAILMAQRGAVQESIDIVTKEIISKSSGHHQQRSYHQVSSPKLFLSHTVNSLVRDYLELIANFTKDVTVVKNLSNQLIKFGHIRPDNKSLRPQVTVHLVCDDLNGALNEFYSCVKQYRKTPGQNILVDLLIDQQRWSNIDELFNLCCGYFNKSDVVFDLVNRLVFKGYPERAKNLLTMSNVSINKQLIENIIEHSLAKEDIKYCLELTQFYGSKLDEHEKSFLYNRIYNLCLTNDDQVNIDKVRKIMKQEKLS